MDDKAAEGPGESPAEPAFPADLQGQAQRQEGGEIAEPWVRSIAHRPEQGYWCRFAAPVPEQVRPWQSMRSYRGPAAGFICFSKPNAVTFVSVPTYTLPFAMS